eukprot:jgi/Tetstr1/425208/TSEL_015669.t1
MESRFGPHSIDRFASALNTLLPRYNAAWLDPTCEAVDSLHLPDAGWRRENNWCNAPWPLLPDLVQKLEQSGAAATVVAPRWEGKAWHQALTEMAVEELTVALRAGLFRPGRRDGVRKGLAASQVTLNPELMRAPLPARVVLKALTLAKALRLELGTTWGMDPSTVVRMELFRASLTVVVLSLFFYLQRRSGGGVSYGRRHGRPGRRDPPIPCIVTGKASVARMQAKKLLCQLPASAHADIAALLHYFDAARHVFAGGRVLAARWAISQREGQAKWTADTLTTGCKWC